VEAIWKRFEGNSKAIWKQFESILKALWKQCESNLKAIWLKKSSASTFRVSFFVPLHHVQLWEFCMSIFSLFVSSWVGLFNFLKLPAVKFNFSRFWLELCFLWGAGSDVEIQHIHKNLKEEEDRQAHHQCHPNGSGSSEKTLPSSTRMATASWMPYVWYRWMMGPGKLVSWFFPTFWVTFDISVCNFSPRLTLDN